MLNLILPALPVVLFLLCCILLLVTLRGAVARRVAAEIGAALVIILAGFFWIDRAFAQSAGDLVNAACSDAARPYLIWALGVIGVANIIAWSKRIMLALPAPLRVAIHFAAGNWRTLAAMAGKVAPVLLIAMLASCANPPKPVVNAAAVLQTPTAQSLINGVGNFSPGVSQVVAKVNQGLAVAQSDKAMACGGMSYADAAFKLLAPKLGASAADLANEAASMKAVEDLCDSDSSNLGAAVATVAKAYSDTTAVLQAAGAPVPAAPPVTAPAAAQ